MLLLFVHVESITDVKHTEFIGSQHSPLWSTEMSCPCSTALMKNWSSNALYCVNVECCSES